ncbi:MAG: sigma-70 family RNA polymerase sigma factor [Xanthomonadales bacterium]|nr:sigma-70 family RNA polymerase sigma factor [Xanthomonadales bacterium]MCE7930270.1 sigma-70 family RNA polymerase sigma factor [Xanthomonadales bacterium PRO6]
MSTPPQTTGEPLCGDADAFAGGGGDRLLPTSGRCEARATEVSVPERPRRAGACTSPIRVLAANPDMSVRTTTDPVVDDPAGNIDGEAFAQLLAAADAGLPAAWDRIYALLYADLHRIARSQIRRQATPRLSPTSLISETWLRLSGAHLKVDSRRHLTALIARAMRFVLIDQARRVLSDAHAADDPLPLDEDVRDAGSQARLEQLLSLDQALSRLADIEPRLARVVELRYFGGASEREAAEALGVTERTISRDWRKARAYLLSRLDEEGRAIGI